VPSCIQGSNLKPVEISAEIRKSCMAQEQHGGPPEKRGRYKRRSLKDKLKALFGSKKLVDDLHSSEGAAPPPEKPVAAEAQRPARAAPRGVPPAPQPLERSRSGPLAALAKAPSAELAAQSPAQQPARPHSGPLPQLGGGGLPPRPPPRPPPPAKPKTKQQLRAEEKTGKQVRQPKASCFCAVWMLDWDCKCWVLTGPQE